MERKFIDTNIFLRFLTKDDPSKYDKCSDFDIIDGIKREEP